MKRMMSICVNVLERPNAIVLNATPNVPARTTGTLPILSTKRVSAAIVKVSCVHTRESRPMIDGQQLRNCEATFLGTTEVGRGCQREQSKISPVLTTIPLYKPIFDLSSVKCRWSIISLT